MPRPKKGSPEAKAWAAKMKAKREAKKVEDPTPPQIDQNDVGALLRRIEELEKQRFFQEPQPQVTARGIVGTVTRYSVDPKDYPDPRERLANEPKLEQHAFKHNFELDWDVGVSSYQTKDGINMREPRFHLNLLRIIMDEDTGEPTNKRYTVCKGVFFEDPDAALVVAREKGLEIPEYAEKPFLDEMRYLQMRDWVLEAFYPPKPNQNKINKTETVIGNRLVEVFEINSEQAETIPFGQLKTKL